MTWVRIRSWHVVAFTTRTGAVKTRCGRLLRVQGTINTPGLETQQIHLTADAKTAFLELGRGRIGIVHSIGDCFLTRIVTAADVSVSNSDETNTFLVRLTDFTWKGGRFRFANAGDAQALLKALEARHAAREAV